LFLKSAALERASCTSCRLSAGTPVVHMPMVFVILNMLVTLVGSNSLSGTFF
jgi:hypothetical protein